MKRILFNLNYINKTALKLTGGIFAIIGFVGMFAPLDSIFSDDFKIIQKIGLSCLILGLVWFITFLICCVYIYSKKQYRVLELGNGHHVFVKYGDIFSASVINQREKRRNVVIPVNRCFDTIVDDDLISSQTLHGISMNQLYADNLFTQRKLNTEIQRKLKEQNAVFENVEIDDKPRGNRKRYAAGTIVEIPASNEITYFFLGYTNFDKDLHANTSEEDYVLALMRLLLHNNKRSQGHPLILPLIGAGAADLRKDERDILEYIMKLIKLNRTLINCDVYIVIREDAKERIAITNL